MHRGSRADRLFYKGNRTTEECGTAIDQPVQEDTGEPRDDHTGRPTNLCNTHIQDNMIKFGELLYQELQLHLLQCFNKGLPHLVEIECAFRTSERYRRKMSEHISQCAFPDKIEEISFYKNVYPCFLSESAFYRLLNYGYNFCPTDAMPEEKKRFWTSQLTRLGKYKIKHSEFYAYYESGRTDLDDIHFTMPLPGRYDLLIGELRARERYADYAGEQLRSIKED
jgi:RteC protein